MEERDGRDRRGKTPNSRYSHPGYHYCCFNTVEFALLFSFSEYGSVKSPFIILHIGLIRLGD
jgi:hypothetical protein